MHKSIIPALLAATLLAAPVMAQQKSNIKLQDNAPDSYVVKRGDTLWSISGKFLQDPWRWPEIWRMNAQQVKNPHWIYPGNVIVLDRSGDQPELKMGGTVKYEPRVRTEDLARDAIPSIPPRVIEPYLSRPLVIEADGLEKAPRIVSAQADRVYLGSGDVAYVKGIKDAALDSIWQIYRQGNALIDPETDKGLGYEAIYLGSGKVTRTGDPATIAIFGAQREIGAGDRLIAAGPLTLNTYVPHAPGKPIKGSIMATFGGLGETGPQSIVALNRGTNDGLEPGNVLALSRLGRTVEENKETTKLPDERYGLVFVFRTFNQVSYALVMSATRPVILNDVVSTP